MKPPARDNSKGNKMQCSAEKQKGKKGKEALKREKPLLSC